MIILIIIHLFHRATTFKLVNKKVDKTQSVKQCREGDTNIDKIKIMEKDKKQQINQTWEAEIHNHWGIWGVNGSNNMGRLCPSPGSLLVHERGEEEVSIWCGRSKCTKDKLIFLL